jgi:opacity protein-like surface antigen
MTRRLVASIASILLAAGAAFAQDVKGPKRTEITSAIFAGGMVIMPSPQVGGPASRNYLINLALTRNLTRWIGVEADGGVALSQSQTHDLYGTVPDDARTSNLLLYSGNVVVNAFSDDRPVMPYLIAGLGAVRTFSDEDAAASGLAANTTYLTGSAGAGARWFPETHWGMRVDYRYLAIKNDAPAPPAGQRIVRSAHQIYVALILRF